MPASLNTRMAGVILAGGKSTRMGSNKALLAYRGARLVDYIARTMKDANLPVYVSGDIAPFVCIPDVIANIGPLGGIISAVEFLQTLGMQAAIFVPVDMPCMNAQLLCGLIAACDAGDTIHYHNHPLPLLLHFSADVISVLNDLKANHAGDCSIGGLINQSGLQVCRLLPDDAANIALTNVNTPEDWKLLLR